MAYLKWRRVTELLALDRPWADALLRRGGPRAPEPEGAAAEAAWDAVYARGAYDHLPRSDQRHHHRLLAALAVEVGDRPSVLEIGCGEGVFYESLRRMAVGPYLGVDVAPIAIERAQARFAGPITEGRARFVVGDGRGFAPDDRFDVIAFPECVEYLGDPARVLAHYAPFLEPGGAFAMSLWLSSNSVRLWRRFRDLAEVVDEAVVQAPWGGAWLVATLKPKA